MMGILLKLTCLILLLGITYGRSSSIFDNPFPKSDVDNFFSTSDFDNFFPTPDFDDIIEDWFPSSIFDDFDRMMTKMNQHFHQMSVEHANDTEMIKKKLINVKPVCTTTPSLNSNKKSTLSSNQKNRRKRFRATQTTVCIREKVINGTRYIQKEEKIIDDKGTIISEKNNFQSFASSTNNTMAFTSTNEH